MKYIHYGKDYGELITQIPASELKRLGITDEKYMFPFNPAVKPNASNIKIAFFGINAYSGHFDEKANYKNFLVAIQDNEYQNLFKVIEMYRTSINQAYIGDGAVYFSNFVKIVLRQDKFMAAETVSRVMRKCPEAMKLHKRAVKSEIDILKKQGCKLFVAFGEHAYHFLKDSSPETTFIWEYHFSWRYWEPKYTEKEIEEINNGELWDK